MDSTVLDPPVTLPTLPMPAMAPAHGGGLQVLRALRRNAYSAFPARCLDEPVVSYRVPGRSLVLTAWPDTIRHVMITHSDDYVRLPLGRRVLGPIVGKGLLSRASY